MPKRTKKEGYIFDVPKDDPSLALEDDEYFEDEDEEEEIKGVPKGFNFENLQGDDDDEEKMLKKLLDKEYSLNEKRVSKSKQKAKSKKAKEEEEEEEDDDVLLGLKGSLDKDDFDEDEGNDNNDDDDEMEEEEEEEDEEKDEEEEEENDEGLSFDTLSALDNALSIEKNKKKSLKIEKRLKKISEQINSDRSLGTLPSDAPPYLHAKKVGNYLLVNPKRERMSLSDRGPSTEIQNFLKTRLYGRKIERMPAHVVVKNGALSKEAIGTKYKVKAKNLRVQRLHAKTNGNLTPKQAGIRNPNVHRHFYPKRK